MSLQQRKVKFDEEDGMYGGQMGQQQQIGQNDMDHYYQEDDMYADQQQQQYNQQQMYSQQIPSGGDFRNRPSEIDSLNFGSYKSKQNPYKITLNDSQGQRTHAQMEKEVFAKARDITRSMNRHPTDDINLTFTPKHQDAMRKFTEDLYDFLSDKTGKLDWTELKAYMYMANVQYSNPTLFKKINDQALMSSRGNQQTQNIDKKAFSDLFLNQTFLKRDITQAGASEPPDLLAIAELFEFLDEDRTGMIEAKDLMTALTTAERLKAAAFEYDKFTAGLNVVPPELANILNLMQKEVDELIQSFDLTGDKMIGPEEFFNIIMYAYDA